MNTYKIKDSLFIVGNKVISYETHVATIQGNKLIEKGKYSRTTGKHVSHVAGLLGLELVRSDKSMKGTFYKFDQGAVMIDEVKRAISPKTSIKILNLLKDGTDYMIAILSLKNEMSKKDWELLDKPKNIPIELERGVSLLSRVGVF